MTKAAKQPRVLCVGIPVRDLTFRIEAVPDRGNKIPASAYGEICGGNALNAAIGIARLGGKARMCGPMGDAEEAASRFIFDKLAEEGIDSSGLIHMPGLVTPISAVLVDTSGERTIVTFRDPGLWKVTLQDADALLSDCDAILTESRCASFVTPLCAAAAQRSASAQRAAGSVATTPAACSASSKSSVAAGELTLISPVLALIVKGLLGVPLAMLKLSGPFSGSVAWTVPTTVPTADFSGMEKV